MLPARVPVGRRWPPGSEALLSRGFHHLAARGARERGDLPYLRVDGESAEPGLPLSRITKEAFVTLVYASKRR